ncbi:hypothetical protein SNEBB_009768 [Seison nebaliae]|nr:hypothetical protein SNEBB_009768 [Seison nebaliae]
MNISVEGSEDDFEKSLLKLLPVDADQLKRSANELHEVSRYCDERFLENSNHKVYKSTEQLAIQSLAGIACQVNRLSTNFKKMLNCQQNNLEDLNCRIERVNSQIASIREKAARHCVGKNTMGKNTIKGVRISGNDNPPKIHNYERKQITFNEYDNVGIGKLLFEQSNFTNGTQNEKLDEQQNKFQSKIPNKQIYFNDQLENESHYYVSKSSTSNHVDVSSSGTSPSESIATSVISAAAYPTLVRGNKSHRKTVMKSLPFKDMMGEMNGINYQNGTINNNGNNYENNSNSNGTLNHSRTSVNSTLSVKQIHNDEINNNNNHQQQQQQQQQHLQESINLQQQQEQRQYNLQYNFSDNNFDTITRRKPSTSDNRSIVYGMDMNHQNNVYNDESIMTNPYNPEDTIYGYGGNENIIPIKNHMNSHSNGHHHQQAVSSLSHLHHQNEKIDDSISIRSMAPSVNVYHQQQSSSQYRSMHSNNSSSEINYGSNQNNHHSSRNGGIDQHPSHVRRQSNSSVRSAYHQQQLSNQQPSVTPSSIMMQAASLNNLPPPPHSVMNNEKEFHKYHSHHHHHPQQQQQQQQQKMSYHIGNDVQPIYGMDIPIQSQQDIYGAPSSASSNSSSTYGYQEDIYMKNKRLPPPQPQHVQYQQPKCIDTVRAMFNYAARRDDELTFDENAVIHVLQKNDDGWYDGYIHGTNRRGFFPGNYVESI